MFEQLVVDLLSSNSLTAENKTRLKGLVNSTLDGILSNSTLQVIVGDSMLSTGCFAGFFVIILALLFKEGVPIFVVLLFLTVLIILLFMYCSLKQLVEQLVQMKRRIAVVQPSLAVMKSEVKEGTVANFVKGLMQKAQCGPLVARDVQTCATNIHALMCMNVVVEACSDVLASIQGKFERAKGGESFGLDISDSSNKVTKADALKEIEKMTKSIDAIRQATDVRVDANARAARLAVKVEDAVVGLRRGLEFDLQSNLHSRPDWLLSNSKKEHRDEVIRKRRSEVGQLCRDLKEFLNEIQDTGDELECRKVTKQCSTMIKFLAFGPQLQGEHRKAMEEAVKMEEQLKDELAESIRNLARREAELAALQDQMQIQQQSFDLRLQMQNQKLDSQKDLLRGLGQGTITMRGTPYDDLTKKYWELWQKGKFSEITEMGTYRSGSFSVIIDSEMTSEQKKGMDLLAEYISELDQMKQSHQVKMMELSTAKMQCSEALLLAREKKTKAEQRVKEAEQKNEPLWSMFAASHPVEFSEVKMLYNTRKMWPKLQSGCFMGTSLAGLWKCSLTSLRCWSQLRPSTTAFVLCWLNKSRNSWQVRTYPQWLSWKVSASILWRGFWDHLFKQTWTWTPQHERLKTSTRTSQFRLIEMRGD